MLVFYADLINVLNSGKNDTKGEYRTKKTELSQKNIFSGDSHDNN